MGSLNDLGITAINAQNKYTYPEIELVFGGINSNDSQEIPFMMANEFRSLTEDDKLKVINNKGIVMTAYINSDDVRHITPMKVTDYIRKYMSDTEFYETYKLLIDGEQ